MLDYIYIGKIDNVTTLCNTGSVIGSGVVYKIETVSTIAVKDTYDACIMNEFLSFARDAKKDHNGYVLISRDEIEATERKIEDLVQANTEANKTWKHIHENTNKTWGHIYEETTKLKQEAELKARDLEKENEALKAELKGLKDENEKLKKKICELEADKTAELVLSAKDNALIFRRAGTETRLNFDTLQTSTYDINGGCKIEKGCKFNIYSDKLGGHYCSHGMIPVMKCLNADHSCPFYEKEVVKR